MMPTVQGPRPPQTQFIKTPFPQTPSPKIPSPKIQLSKNRGISTRPPRNQPPQIRPPALAMPGARRGRQIALALPTALWAAALWAAALLLAAAWGLTAQAQEAAPESTVIEAEELVVTATRTEIPAAEVGSSITVITHEEIEALQPQGVEDLLRALPGVDITRTGGPGGLSKIRLRGTEADHTLVLIDGIVINNPLDHSADLSDLSVLDVERIEILRGPQSTLYGSDAIGGVVQIFTRSGTGPTQVFLSAETGSFNTTNAQVSLSGGSPHFHYSLAAGSRHTKGISAADQDNGNPERDGFQSRSISLNLGYSPSDILEFGLLWRASESESDLDDADPFPVDDPNYTSETSRRFARLQGSLNLFEGNWNQTVGIARSAHLLRHRDPDHTDSSSNSAQNAVLEQLDWRHIITLHETNTLLLGFETQTERLDTERESSQLDKSAKIDSYYIQDRLAFSGRYFVTLGLRSDNHEQFGTEQTQRLTLAMIVPESDTTLRASYGTGFRAPTLSDLFSPFGNPNLMPERSRGYDLGLEQLLLDENLTLGLTYFENHIEDLIGFNKQFQSVNIDKAEIKGTEWLLAAHPMETLDVVLNLTQQTTKAQSTAQRLLRRPETKARLDVAYRPTDPLGINLRIYHVGEQDDTNFKTVETVTLKAYTLVDLATQYDITEKIRLTARIENATNQEYVEVFGYGTPERAYYAGAQVLF